MLPAPRHDLRRRLLVAQPDIVRVRISLIEHRGQGPVRHRPRLRRRARHHERDPQARNLDARIDPAQSVHRDDEVHRLDGEIEQQQGIDDEAGPADPVPRLEPPGPELREAGQPAQAQQAHGRPVDDAQRGDEQLAAERASRPDPPVEHRSARPDLDNVAVGQQAQVGGQQVEIRLRFGEGYVARASRSRPGGGIAQAHRDPSRGVRPEAAAAAAIRGLMRAPACALGPRTARPRRPPRPR